MLFVIIHCNSSGTDWGEARGKQVHDEGGKETAGILPLCPAQLWKVIGDIH